MELGDQGSQGGGASLAPGTVVLSNLLGFSFQHPWVWTAPRFPLSLLAHFHPLFQKAAWLGRSQGYGVELPRSDQLSSMDCTASS